ncbi:hypothetical protein GJ629_11255 [Halapricum sp. CBA1109]|uniref:DUF5518 domain-containing protein n=1 Tax=Halapricum sp. CBA1109 TaxID=2668068 RepID=UPI0012F9F769|nr:DUF5518 domain-containing protein [Halapricum sp. CBA1109]MUV90409.1 hypothetical protein [Halapricum sp. CBA1109]
METTDTAAGDGRDSATSEPRDDLAVARPLPEYVDWLVGVAIALGGMALFVGGTAVTFVVDRELLAQDIEAGEITIVVLQRDLTEAEMLEFSLEVVNWTGIGLLLTGIGLVLFAIGYVGFRHRAHQRVTDEGVVGTYRSSAVLGAVATSVLSFAPFSPVLGGGLAGYLEQPASGRPVSVGALSGFVAMVPALVILGFVTIGLYLGFATIQEAGLGFVVVAGMVFGLLVVSAYGAGLGALGGFAGGRLAQNSSDVE